MFFVQRLTFSEVSGLKEKRQNDVLRGNVSMDASPEKLLKIHTFNSFVPNAPFLFTS